MSIDSSPESSSDQLVKQWALERPDVNMEMLGTLLRIRALAMLMDQISEKETERLGLKSAELYLLYAIRRGGPPYRMRPTDIYKLLRVTSGTITYRIDRLEKEGFVKRIPDPDDRRSVVVELTQRGLEVVDNSVDSTVKMMSGPTLSAFASDAEFDSFTRVLRRLGWNFDELIEGNDNPLIHPPLALEAVPGGKKKKAVGS